MTKTFISLLLLLAVALPVQAANTPSGAVISSAATVNYAIAGMNQPAITSLTSFPVDSKVDVLVTRTADAAVLPGSTGQVLAFTITNLGNTSQRYRLSALPRATDNFDMNNVRIFRDNGGTPGLLDGGDTLYIDSASFGDVVSGGTVTVLIASDAPVSQVNAETAVYDLVAETIDAGSTSLTVQTAGGDTGGIDVLFADGAGSHASDLGRDGKHSAFGTYTVSDVTVAVNKNVSVVDQFGGSQPVPGAVLRYTITVTVVGSNAANGIVITDPVPADTTYAPGSLRLNGALLSDGADADAGEVAGAPSTVTVRLGNLTAASPMQTIIFDVRIN